MTSSATVPPPATAAETASVHAAPLVHRPGRWIDNWNPESRSQWEGGGREIAARNLRWSIFAEFLGFVVWQLWSIVVVQLPAAGFSYDTGQIFWLISIPGLVGATLRFPYTFMVPKFGGRNWTMISAALLLIPATALEFCVGNPETPFWLMLIVAALGGFGRGNFTSPMSNITFFYPQREKAEGVDVVAAGSISAEPWDAELGDHEHAEGCALAPVRVSQWADPEHGRYVKMVTRAGILEGFVSVGMPRTAAELTLLFERASELPADRSVLLRFDGPDFEASAEGGTFAPDATVCWCNGVSVGQVVEAAAGGDTTVACVGTTTRAGTGCGGCKGRIADVLAWAEAGEQPGVAVTG